MVVTSGPNLRELRQISIRFFVRGAIQSSIAVSTGGLVCLDGFHFCAYDGLFLSRDCEKLFTAIVWSSASIPGIQCVRELRDCCPRMQHHICGQEIAVGYPP